MRDLLKKIHAAFAAAAFAEEGEFETARAIAAEAEGKDADAGARAATVVRLPPRRRRLIRREKVSRSS